MYSQKSGAGRVDVWAVFILEINFFWEAKRKPDICLVTVDSICVWFVRNFVEEDVEATKLGME